MSSQPQTDHRTRGQAMEMPQMKSPNKKMLEVFSPGAILAKRS